MNTFDLLLIALAAHRLWATWLYMEVARPLRERVMRLGPKFAYGASCTFCVSAWAGAAAVGLWYSGSWGRVAILALAIGPLVLLYEILMTVVTRLSEFFFTKKVG